MITQLETSELKGITFQIDENGRKKAVVIDLDQYGNLLEDFFDLAIARQRMSENDTISFDDLKKELN
ncbi:MAG: hypothetical protein AAF741_11125 [Bacteroidota bacterium]